MYKQNITNGFALCGTPLKALNSKKLTVEELEERSKEFKVRVESLKEQKLKTIEELVEIENDRHEFIIELINDLKCDLTLYHVIRREGCGYNCDLCKKNCSDVIINCCEREYCRECITNWFQNRNCCPYCKKRYGRLIMERSSKNNRFREVIIPYARYFPTDFINDEAYNFSIDYLDLFNRNIYN